MSSGPFRSLNLGALTADEAANVAENRRRAVRPPAATAPAATMAWQVHGADVREVDERPAPGRFLEPGVEAFPKSDGLVTSLPARPLVLLTADCLPVAIARADGRRLALLHAGWRGLVAGIVERGVERGRPAGRPPRSGRARGRAATRWATTSATCSGAGSASDVVRDGKADLWLAARRALEGAGVADVEVAGECTICGGERYFSHRRDRGTTGRQGVVGVLRA